MHGYGSSNPHTSKMLMFDDSMMTTIDNFLKETMISQEGVFRKQVFELHRLYGIQRNLMENFGWKKMNEYGLWNANAHSNHDHNYVVECSKESLKLDEVNLSLCLRGDPGVSGEATKGKGKQWWYNHHHHHGGPVIIDLEEPEVSNLCGTMMKKKDEDDDDSCIIIIQDGTTGSTSSIKGLPNLNKTGILDLNKQPEDEDDDNSSDIFFKNSIVDSNSNSSSSCCNRGEEKCIIDNENESSFPIDLNSMSNNNNRDSVEEELKEIGANGDSSSCRRVVDLAILEAVESLMSIQLEVEQPQRSLDSYELIVLNLEEENSDDWACVSSKGCENVNSDRKDKEKEVNLARRGRRVKDFQKDVLPSLACLSRQEIREDVNIMEAVIKSREYKRIMKAKTEKTIGRGVDQKWFMPVKRSKRSKLNYGVRNKC